MKQVIGSLIFLFLLAGCEKNSFYVSERTNPRGNALIKMALFSTTATSVNLLISINDQRVSNPVPNFNGAFPGGGLNTSGSANSDYLIVSPGDAKITLDVPISGTGVSASKYFEGTQKFDADKRYVCFVADTGANTSSFAVNVDTPTPDSGYATMQFSHAIPNVASVDVYKGANAATATLLFSNVNYKSGSEFAVFPVGTDSVFIRTAGSPATSAPIARRAFNFTNQRIFSVASRGYSGVTSGNRAPTLSAFYVQ